MRREPSEKSKASAREIAGLLNQFGIDYEGIAQAMLSEHRTLQQNLTRLCREWLIALANAEEWNIDGRNEASYELAKKCKEICENSPLPFV